MWTANFSLKNSKRDITRYILTADNFAKLAGTKMKVGVTQSSKTTGAYYFAGSMRCEQETGTGPCIKANRILDSALTISGKRGLQKNI